MTRLSSARLALAVSLITLGGFGCVPQSKPQCVTAADCSGATGDCQENACIDGACRVQPRAAGTRVEAQVTGDCRVAVCNGNGGLTSSVDDMDVPVDGNECTRDVCTAGTPSNPPQPASTACGMNGALSCDGQGQCVSCRTADDCSMGTACQVRTCTAGVCGFDNVAQGTRAGTQTAGDCKVSQCNGQGAVEVVADNADLPVDGVECTQDVCTAGTPSNPPVTAGTTCTENDGSRCNASGACVQCVVAADCPGIDTECQVRTCTAGVCGRSYTTDGTAVRSQTANDCRKNVCDGQGRVVNRADDTDLPNDNNACTTDTCNAGAPVFANRTAGETCGTDLICDGNGACVGCNTPADCPGSDTECSTRTCVNNVCGRNNVANNTPTQTQTPNDCRRTVCDGNGNAVNQNDNTDLPADDGNQCTTEGCNAGTPVFTPRAVNTACTQDNGAFCNAVGQCVQCNAPTQCPGTDGECSTRTCVSGTCGVSNVAANTPTATQTAGDCQQRQCDGTGGVVSVALNTDVPADDGNQCTSQTCSNGAPSFPAVTPGATCSQNGGTLCSGTSCVQCIVAADCPGSDTECSTRTCNAGVCGVNNTQAGTPTATQTAGDCQQRQCNGTGGVVSVALNTDLPPDDTNECTTAACVNGAPAQAPKAQGDACTQNGGSVCDGAGACVGCTTASQCPGSDTECSVRSCTNGTCGRQVIATSGTVVSSQTAGDCQQRVCDGAGEIISLAFDSDLPIDNNECTQDLCTSGVPSNPFLPADTSCGTNGTQFCSPTGQCVQCNQPTQCAGSDSFCQARTCNGNVCGIGFTAAGTQLPTQTAGDCKVDQCNGTGGVETVNADTDVPTDDNQCTTDTCSNGSPVFANTAADVSCSQNGGVVCDGAGACVACNQASQCPGQDTECRVRTCSASTCGFSNVAQGTVTATQTPGDCKQAQCDGNGGGQNIDLLTDVPEDNNECTANSCAGGFPTNPPLPAGTDCAQNGGNTCNGSGTCVAAPIISTVVPANGATAVAVSSNVVITFSKSMDAASITGQSTHGACTGSIQLSRDDFASCLPITTSLSGAVVTVTAAPGLAFGTSYKVRVTTAVRDNVGAPLRTQFSMVDGFTTAAPPLTTVVISQVYGGSNATGSTYNADFVELHNRAATPISIGGWSIQYASATGNFGGTQRISIPAGTTLAPGQYYLIRTQNAGTTAGVAVPSPDATGTTIDMARANGKLALVNSTTALPAVTCPTSEASVVDFVSWGVTNCAEGTSGPSPANTSVSSQRRDDGCLDVNDNSADFFTATVLTPRNTSTPAKLCAVTYNETGLGGELDYCNVQFPTSLTVAPGATTPTVYAQAYEAGSTEGPGASTNLQCEIGWGPVSANPQWQSGWTWTVATFNTQAGSNDEWQATFTAPASAGTYRYGARFSYDGVNWTYCDLNGAGSNAGLSFETAQLPVLTVQ